MKFTLGFVGFLCGFIFYTAIGFNIFPVDENNVLQAPDIYPLIGVVFCSLSSYLFIKILGKQFNARKKSSAYSNSYWSRLTREQKYKLAKDAVIEFNDASASFLQRKFGISYREATELICELEIGGIISPYNGANPRVVYESANFANTKTLGTIDTMDGHEFEHWCADLLRKNGFSNVEVTPASGDHGVDVLAEKDGVNYAIQCKCYSNDLGNTPVQEVYAGKEMYRCQVGVVMTNRYFTTGAKQLAEQTRVLLWDRDKLQSLIESAKQNL